MTTLTGTLSVNGTLVTGNLWLELSQLAYAAGGVAVSPSAPSVFQLTNGAITGPGAGPYTVYGNDVLTPAQTFYGLTVFGSQGEQLLRGNVSITGASQDIGAFATASTQVWVALPIYSSGAANITGGSVQALLRDKGGTAFDAKAYSVVMDGSTDDTAAIQALVDARVSGETVVFPAGRIKVSNTIQIGNGSVAGASTVSYLSFRGAGHGIDIGNLNPGYGAATSFEWAGAAGVPMFQLNGPICVNMSDFDVLGTAGGNSCGDAFLCYYTMMSTFERISVRRHGGWAMNQTVYTTRPTGAANNPANTMLSQFYAFYGQGSSYGGLSIDSPDTGGGVGCDVVQFSALGCKFTGSAGRAAVQLGFTDNVAFHECLLHNQAAGPALKIYPFAPKPTFPAVVAFYNCPIIGTPHVVVDETRSAWTPATLSRGVGFYPWNTGDSGTFPLSTDGRFHSIADNGEVSGKHLTLKSSHIHTSGAAPVFTLGAAAGAGATITLYNCTDTAGMIRVTTGTAPAVNDVVVTAVYARPFPARSHVVLTPEFRFSAQLYGGQQVDTQGVAAQFTINSGGIALAAATAYWWTYHVIGV